MFSSLSEKLQDVFKRLRGKGKLTEKDIKDAMKEVKLALLEADVNYKVVKDFINTVTQKAVGEEVLESLTPAQQVIKIVYDEMVNLLGGSDTKLTFSPSGFSTYMMVGLQGSGKTTTAGKLAGLLKRQGKNPLLVACDIYRPAAIKQLEVVAQKVGVKCFADYNSKDAVKIAKEGIEFAKVSRCDVAIVDTAGRLHINQELMDELVAIKNAIKPTEILLVLDAMTGQDAVNVAAAFNEQLGIDGIIMTKLDGDTRGGAALSVKAITGKPIKFAGVGEKMEDLEAFHPDRMASRILGMGDILTLIEKAQEAIDQKKAEELEKKLRSMQFTLEDFLDQLKQIKKMGSLSQIISMIPGVKLKGDVDFDAGEKELKKIEAIINSMTKEERQDPSIINSSRKRRIAMGSGTTVQDVNRLLRQFEDMKRMMKQFSNPSFAKKGKFKFPFM
ncbi:signal recognition particle subunit FFH/SRP54 (srp54) [Caldicellulosiruptor bescii]|uniref:Signal recognition particle protein n=2 Tax=Caldicellulosiruptor bescii TaxID=31899 RepID=B9MQW6_CALBD|nr:signal recognition particle protein [Caldicellulosiruptor bescii]ACM60070.1 signal recognition particle protein [Caldicellulosiruptor bescii DSM 6725]PBC87483.1 signal recognition particle subunit FFH/SRP54 (srp54) [Caldicellulosiruptor bescii]PBC90416.1 signal recognition particle subunit FFH/SRP54 (srp54) [Caldicellulosiruptor bescii]PBD04152.1 signal recognition particle subunit FFH/SRP54 (srp54) [Caldicellulosiruptor bescii]PBD06213.1 signal recognition particle subunit FFH/SRP54 (srp54